MTGVTLPRGSVATTSLGLGCAYITAGFEERGSSRILDAAFDAGLRHFDVAPVYGMGTAEDVVGRAFAGRRDRITLATKVGLTRPQVSSQLLLLRALARPVRRLVPTLARSAGNRVVAATSSRGQFGLAFVERSLAESLRRLKTDYLDLLLLHEAVVDGITDELLTFLDKKRAEGVARAIGVGSDFPRAIAIAAAHRGVFDVYQFGWSVLDKARDFDRRDGFIITHRALLRAFGPMKAWLSRDDAARARLSEATGVDLASQDVLARTLLAAALAHNSGGIVLVASRRVDRARAFGELLADAASFDAGRKLAAAMAAEPDAPSPDDGV